jgi:DNA primase
MISTTGILAITDAETQLKHVNDLEIFAYYMPNLKLNKRQHSPLRKDTDPSFTVFQSKSGNLLYHDFSTGETGDAMKFVMQLFGLSYKQAVTRIITDLKGKQTFVPKQRLDLILEEAKKREISVITRKYGSRDLMYWEQYGIRAVTLSKYRVYCLENVFLDGMLVSEYRNSQPVYGYYLGPKAWKIYKPYSHQRFFQNTTIMQGYAQLPETGDLLIISKSMKDVLLLHELGLPAVAPHGERVGTLANIDELRKRFKRIVVFFDNDTPGIEGAKHLADLYGLEYIFIPVDEKAKDLTDYYKINNFEKTRALLDSLLWKKEPLTQN